MGGDHSPLLRLFSAFASEPRLQLLEALNATARPLCVADFARLTELPRLTASHHLAILRNAGVVEVISEGARLNHTIRADALWPIEDWLYSLISDTVSANGSGDG